MRSKRAPLRALRKAIGTLRRRPERTPEELAQLRAAVLELLTRSKGGKRTKQAPGRTESAASDAATPCGE